MGQILKSKISQNGKIIFQIELTQKEARNLKNHAKKIHIFSENLCIHETNIIERGANFGAKSVPIPFALKSRKKLKFLEIGYQKIEEEEKIFYIAVAKKDPLFN